MEDHQLTLLAMVLEVGFIVLLVLLFFLKPVWRKRVAPVLGALTPIALVYLIITSSYLLDASDPQSSDFIENNWAFHAMWVMSFAVFCFSLLIGMLVAFLRQPKPPLLRYTVGLSVVVIVAAVMVIKSHWRHRFLQ